MTCASLHLLTAACALHTHRRPDLASEFAPNPAELQDQSACREDAKNTATYLSVVFGAVVAILGLLQRSAAECGCANKQGTALSKTLCQLCGSCCVAASLCWAMIALIIGIILLALVSSSVNV